MSAQLDSVVATLAGRLDRARSDARRIDPPAELASLTLAQAYDVQDAVVAPRSRGGDRQSGWKLGITSPVKQRVMGISHPLFGRTFAGGENASGGTVTRATLVNPRAEPELAFGLAAGIDPAMDAAALAAAIAWIAPALEITDSRYRSGTRTAVELIADNTSSAAYVLGDRVALRGGPSIEPYATALLRNGVVVANGSTLDVLGDPVNALRALAVHLAAQGLRAAAGDVVLSGAITDAVPVAPGDLVEARLSGLGDATIRFV